MSSLDILWYSRSAHPSPLGLAAQLGGFVEEFRDDGPRVFTVQDSADVSVRDSHVDHRLPNFIRQGGNVPALWARAQGVNTRLIGLSWMEEFQGLLSLPGQGVQTLDDLRGKRLALPQRNRLVDTARTEALHGFLQGLALVKAGPSDAVFVDLVVPPSDPAARAPTHAVSLFGEYAVPLGALLRHEVDVVYVKGARGLQAARAARAHVVFDLRQHPDPKARVHNGAPRPITVDEELLVAHPDVVERFLARVVSAGEWAADHPRETVAYLSRETRRSEELVREAYGSQVHRHLGTDLSNRSIEALEAHKRFLLDWGFLPRDVDVRRWIDPRPLAAALRRVRAGDLHAPA